MPYPSDLSDAEWQLLQPLLPAPKATGRPRQWDLRLLLDGIFYLVRSGCAWRMLPDEFPPWSTVHRYYRRFRRDGTWERIHTATRAGAAVVWPRGHAQRRHPRQPERQNHGKRGAAGKASIGYDAHKKVKGRKRHLLVDTQGLVLKVRCTGAQCPERIGARQLLEPLGAQFPRLRMVWADQGYRGELETWLPEKLGWRLEIVYRTDEKEHKERLWETARKRRDAGASVVEMWAGLKSGRGIDRSWY